MPSAVPVSFAAPALGAVAMTVALVAIAVAWWRRIDLPRVAKWLMAGGAVGLALGVARPLWHPSQRPSVAVMIDLSPSTRGAGFREAAFVRQRVGQLLGGIPYQLYGFAGRERPLDPAGPWPEMPTDGTEFAPVAADAILLFSDARFALPEATPPIYAVVDPWLENVSDAAVDRLELNGQKLLATVSNSGPARIASLGGVAGPATQPVDDGKIVLTGKLQEGAASASVELNRGDLWPENDALDIRVGPPLASRRWWVGSSAPVGDWTKFSPSGLPEELDQYLAAAVIVLDNISAAQLSDLALDRLGQYVRDLGGSLLILGGDHAFAAGGCQGTLLEELGPLASSPPRAAMRWLLLADASGSMAADAGGGVSRWQEVCGAIAGVLPKLPPRDIVQVGQFSDVLRWWSTGKTAQQTAALHLPPADAGPHGPTNLEAALTQLAAESDAALPSDLLVLSDCDTTIERPRELAELLQKKKIRLDVLALGQGSALEVIRQMASATGGQVVEQLDPAQWFDSASRLGRALMPPQLVRSAAEIHFVNGAASIPAAKAALWNRTWLKEDAELWAQTEDAGGVHPMAASWQVGAGRVAAVAFAPPGQEADQLARLIAARPRDPRFSVQNVGGRKIQWIVDAVDGNEILNDLPITLQIAGDAGTRRDPLEQIAPGRYELDMPAPSRPFIATLRCGGEVIDRQGLAGRYAPEFDALGNDHQAMRALAERSGGAVIPPEQTDPIALPRPHREFPLTGWLCGAAAILLTMGLVRWRLG